MIFASGAGAMQDAARAMRKLHNRATRAGDRAKGRRRRGSGSGGSYEPEKAEFPCAELCGSCGYFLDIEADDDPDHAVSCPSCGDEAWVNLAVEPVASSVREIEAEERQRIPWWVRLAVVGSTAAAIAGTAALLLWAGYGSVGVLTIASALALLPAAYFGLSRPAAVLLLKGRERLPDRWHIPLPLPEEDRSPTRISENVRVEATGESLRAPISDRECLAYQVCALFDTPGDARPAEWALEEQRAASIRVAGGDGEQEFEIEPRQLYLESPVEFVHATGEGTLPVDDDTQAVGAGVDREAVKQFLRARGLFVTEGDYHFYESILQAGDEVDVADYDGETYIVEHTDRPRADEVEALPESLGD